MRSALALATTLILLAGSLAACDKSPAEPASAATHAAPSAPAAATHSAPLALPEPPKPNAIPAPPDVAAPPADAEKTASGLASKVLTPGTGKEHPAPQDRVKVHYTGWTTDGKMFDSSVARGEPTTFQLDHVIKGWTEGVQLMTAGEKRRFWIPANLAYGEHPRPGAPAGTLVFDIELLDITPAPKPPPVPADVKAAPASAKKTKSGLAYRLVKKGTGTVSPKPTDRVEVNYSGWTTDGKMFDSSITRGQPTTFRLDQVIKGWTEGVQLMHVGDVMRFWIPGDLAYGEHPRPGAPAGTLVFDIELLSIK